MYLTFLFIVQIIVAVYLLFFTSLVSAKDFIDKLLFKFVPLVLAAVLVINAFGLVK